MDAFPIVWGTFLILAAILVPGVAVTMALFPKRGQISMTERFGLGLMFGILPQLILYSLSKNFSVQVTTTTIIVSIGLVTLASLAVWQRRK